MVEMGWERVAGKRKRGGGVVFFFTGEIFEVFFFKGSQGGGDVMESLIRLVRCIVELTIDITFPLPIDLLVNC